MGKCQDFQALKSRITYHLIVVPEKTKGFPISRKTLIFVAMPEQMLNYFEEDLERLSKLFDK